MGDPEEELSVDEPLITSGRIDSFTIAQVAVFVETAFDVYIPDNELVVENADTLGQMADLVLQYADQ
jgi:acyl carrier protein